MYSVRRLVIGSCVPSAQTVLCSTKMIWESTFFISLFIYCFYLFLIFFVLFISLFIYYFYLFLIFFFFFSQLKKEKLVIKMPPRGLFLSFHFPLFIRNPKWLLSQDDFCCLIYFLFIGLALLGLGWGWGNSSWRMG